MTKHCGIVDRCEAGDLTGTRSPVTGFGKQIAGCLQYAIPGINHDRNLCHEAADPLCEGLVCAQPYAAGMN